MQTTQSEPSGRRSFRSILSIGCIIGGALMFLDSLLGILNIFNVFAIRFVQSVGQTSHSRSFILNLYVGLFGLLIILCETRMLTKIGLRAVLENLKILQSSRGRALFYIFAGTLALGLPNSELFTLDGKGLDLVAGIWIIVAGFLRFFSNEKFGDDKERVVTIGIEQQV
ncbi:hypothetical protein P9112_006411 [Eukaryota sp. TZLM1-RC]